MPAHQRATLDQIVEAYQQTGSVWKAGKLLGLAGQSVHERLTLVGYQIPGRAWTDDEYLELRALAENGCSIAEIANRLGRSYAGVAAKLSRLGIRIASKRQRKLPRGGGWDKETMKRRLRELDQHTGSLAQFCRARSLPLDPFVRAFQRHFPDAWAEYARTHSDLEPVICPNCDQPFYPMTKKQQTCSRRCQAQRRGDLAYFGGKRRNAVGMIEGICQLCERQVDKGLSAHHIFGKDNDPENDHLVALCPGCHRLVGDLAGRAFAENPRALEALIGLALMRKRADRGTRTDLWISIDIEEWNDDEEDLSTLPEAHHGWVSGEAGPTLSQPRLIER